MSFGGANLDQERSALQPQSLDGFSSRKSENLIDTLENVPDVLPKTRPLEGLSSADEQDDRDHPQRGAVNFRHIVQILRTALPLALFDMLALIGALLIASQLSAVLLSHTAYAHLYKQELPLMAILCIVYIQFGLYPGAGLNPIIELRHIIVGTTLGFLLLLIGNTSFGLLSHFEATFLGWAWVFALVLVPLARRFARLIFSKCAWWGQSALVIGGGVQGARIFHALRSDPSLGLRPVGIVDDPHRLWTDLEPQTDPPPFLGPPEELATITEEHDAHWAIVATSVYSDVELPVIFDRCAWCIPNLIVVPNIDGVPSLWSRVQECAGQPGIHVQARLLLPLPRLIKRMMDLVLVTLGGLMILPLILTICVMIKTRSPGPIFFLHTRIGLNGRRFLAWKFRTMIVNASTVLDEYLASNPAAKQEWDRDHKLKNDPRIIPGIGHFLRRFSFDELPQIWNVFIGEMSLLGPRPIVPAEIKKYEGNFHLYLKVVPGITGLWQISGRNNTTYEERVRLDAYYVRNWSPWLDLYILVRTIKTVALQEGAY